MEVQRYRCGRYEYIRTQAFWEIVPAFGGGCSSTLFNDARERVIPALVKRALKVFQESSSTSPGGVFSGLVEDDDLLTQYPWALRVERFEEERIAPTVLFSKPRSEWRPGTWADEPDLVEWRSDAAPYPLLIVRGHSGGLCGYIGVPEGHSMHGTRSGTDVRFTWSELTEEITAARPCDSLIFRPTGEPPTCWWLGFYAGTYFPALPSLAHPDTGETHYAALPELRQRVEALAVALSRSTFPGKFP